jgi:hypothetical protein
MSEIKRSGQASTGEWVGINRQDALGKKQNPLASEMW